MQEQRNYCRRLVLRVWQDFVLSLRFTVAPSVIVLFIIFLLQVWAGKFASVALARTNLATTLSPYLCFIGLLVVYHLARAAFLLDDERRRDLLRVTEEIAQHVSEIEALKLRIVTLEAKRPIVIPSGQFTAPRYDAADTRKDNGVFIRNIGEESAVNISIASVGTPAMLAEFGVVNALSRSDGAVPVKIMYTGVGDSSMLSVVGLWELTAINRGESTGSIDRGSFLRLRITYMDRHQNAYTEDGYCLRTYYGPAPNDTRMAVELVPVRADDRGE